MDTSIKEQFRTYLSNCVQTRRQTGKSFIIGRTAVDSYVSFVEADKLFDYAPDEWKTIDSIFDITSSEKILQIIEKLFSDERFKTKDSGESSQYYRSNAIKQYYCFLKARELFINKHNYSASKEFEYESIPLQQIFYGAPGTGKSHRIKEIIKEHGIDEKEQVIRTTFHPDSDYSTFVGCYKPIMKSVPQTYVVEGNEKPVMADKDNQATKDEIVYDYTPQAFVQAYTKAWTTDKPVILVIEEINRGNCAQIFGDIFQLLDRGDDGVSEYEIKPDKALENYLKEYFAAFDDLDKQIKTGKIMKLPANLYIWATMNTSDQSLFPIDSAFKRRWEWKYIKIAWPYKKNEDGSFKTDENGKKIHFNYSIEGGYDWWAFLQQINAIIDKMTNSADKQLGYFFAKAKDDIISYDTFVSKVCFYLWNDIFKTYALDEQQGDLFKFAKKIKDKDENEKEVIGHLTFPEFYDGDGNVVPDVARQFIEHVMAWNTEGKKENS
jgi:5-methylcytosine-specific restriction endonuclease McrBC GTP-binding regulatory subunit McrB